MHCQIKEHTHPFKGILYLLEFRVVFTLDHCCGMIMSGIVLINISLVSFSILSNQCISQHHKRARRPILTFFFIVLLCACPILCLTAFPCHILHVCCGNEWCCSFLKYMHTWTGYLSVNPSMSCVHIDRNHSTVPVQVELTPPPTGISGSVPLCASWSAWQLSHYHIIY